MLTASSMLRSHTWRVSSLAAWTLSLATASTVARASTSAAWRIWRASASASSLVFAA